MEPWNLLKTNKAKAATVLYVAAQIVKAAAVVSEPFIPATAKLLWQTLNPGESVHMNGWKDALKPLDVRHEIAKGKPLFRKIDADEKKLDAMLATVREKRV
jgi:methionyl-tRNA synthetase